MLVTQKREGDEGRTWKVILIDPELGAIQIENMRRRQLSRNAKIEKTNASTEL